jgi:hypothetical protein
MMTDYVFLRLNTDDRYFWTQTVGKVMDILKVLSGNKGSRLK